MKIKVQGVKQAQQGLEDFIKRHRRNAAKALVEIAEVAVEQAAYHTPRYSGLASFAWKMDTKPIQIKYFEGSNELNYPEGILSSDSDVEAEQVAYAQRVKMVPKALAAAATVRATGSNFTVYVGNETEYSRLWLDPNNQSFKPRAGNEDFYALNDVMQGARKEAISIIEKLKGSR